MAASIIEMCDTGPVLNYLMVESSELIRETASVPAVFLLAEAHELFRIALHTWFFFKIIPDKICDEIDDMRNRISLEHRNDFEDSRALYFFLNDVNRFLHCVSVRAADNF